MFHYPILDYPTPDDVTAIRTELWPMGTIIIDVNL